MALSTATPGTSNQSATQDPQAATPFTGITASGAGVQPGTPTSSLDTSAGGVPLAAQNLSTVPLSTTKTGSVASVPVHHGINPILGVFSGLLFLAAIVLFISTMRDDKNTTS